MKIQKFEDLEVWKASRKLTNIIYGFTGKEKFFKDFGLRDQIQKASVSCMSNVAEGFDSGSDQEFARFLIYTRRSSSEVQSELYVALDREYICEKEFDLAYAQAKKVGRLSNGFIKYLRK